MKRILAHASSKGIDQYCLMLFGWLTCAKRPLKWHEIQGAKAIDLESHTVDLERRRFLVDAKWLCGSLVEDLPDGTIQFVHLTARWLVKRSLRGTSFTS
jgi:hypothetical protein